MNIIESVNLNKVYHGKIGTVHALKNVSLSVKKGDIFGFLGPNGAGKTTFTKLMVGFIRPTSGTISVLGREVSEQNYDFREKVGLVPDQFGFYPMMTGEGHLDYYARLVNIPNEMRQEKIARLSELPGIL